MSGRRKKPVDNKVTLPDGKVVGWNEWTATEPAIDLKPTPKPDDPDYLKLKEFFFPAPPPPTPYSMAEQFKSEGRCPICGELGRIHLSTMICSTHGVY